MMAAAELTRKGITNYRLIEKAGDFGGTWYWNRYPNAACDVFSAETVGLPEAAAERFLRGRFYASERLHG